MKVTFLQVTTCCARVRSWKWEDNLEVNPPPLDLNTKSALFCGLVLLHNKTVCTLFTVNTFFTIINTFDRGRCCNTVIWMNEVLHHLNLFPQCWRHFPRHHWHSCHWENEGLCLDADRGRDVFGTFVWKCKTWILREETYSQVLHRGISYHC